MIETSHHPGTLNHYTTNNHLKDKPPTIKNFTPRLYQQTIFATASKKNTLVVLPTGLGKTSIAIMLAIQRLKQFPKQKILFLAPTKPLVDQHRSSFIKYTNLEPESLVVFTGHVSPAKRAKLWDQAVVIFSTPQGLENDIINERVKPEEISLVIFDEAHRATGGYAYTFVAKQYHKKAKYPKILGLTASPGSDLEKIMEVFQNLHLEDVEIRTNQDSDVKPYIQETNIKWVKVSLNENLKEVQTALQKSYSNKLKAMVELGYLKKDYIYKFSKTQLLKLQGQLHHEIGKGVKEFNLLKSLSLAAEAMKVQHALELVETQGLTALQEYFDSIQAQAAKSSSKAVKNLVRDYHFKEAQIKTKSLIENAVEHPKLPKLKEILKEIITEQNHKKTKIIIFNQFRDMANKIVEELTKIPYLKPKLFVGQAKKKGKGLSQKQQKEIIEQFKQNEFNILVTTSVAEEGLDIPQVNTVIFYEPIPSAIRHIQRRGRTGRQDKGQVIILMAKGTRDEGYRWSAHHKEKRMYRNLEELKTKIALLSKKQDVNFQRTLVGEQPILIIADDREKGSGVIKDMFDLGATVRLKRLTVGDYLLSPKCIVEFKTIPDFVDSIIDGRLLQQAKELKQQVERPIIIIQGTEDVYAQRKIHPNAIRGMLATLMINYGISILHTKNFKDTANLLTIIAKREQQQSGSDFTYHTSKPLTLKEQQEFVVSSLPGIGGTLSKPLLQQFRTIKNIMTASAEQLQQVEKIGEKKAKDIQKLLTEQYKG